jgi:GNAT superfamily N-acetyltransferase
MSLDIREAPWSDPDGAALRAAQRAELETRYETPDSEPGPAPTAADMTLFLVAFDGDVAVACGGLRAIDRTSGEIKRMYTVPESRGTGAARQVLVALEDAARGLGWQRLRLETGDRQPDAMRFYEREGYTSIPNYGHYVGVDASRCYEKHLVRTRP